ncbi:unnamed protein product [Trichobilharzia szidati]|nr:unnamed protein product [Trichobilharzia szidati]
MTSSKLFHHDEHLISNVSNHLLLENATAAVTTNTDDGINNNNNNASNSNNNNNKLYSESLKSLSMPIFNNTYRRLNSMNTDRDKSTDRIHSDTANTTDNSSTVLFKMEDNLSNFPCNSAPQQQQQQQQRYCLID